MKRFFLTTVAFGLLSGSAFAADLLPVYKTPVVVCSWCGWYAGVNVGAAWSQDPSVHTAGTAVSGVGTFEVEAHVGAGLATTNLRSEQSRFLGGAQVGYNALYGAWLLGAEADIQGLTKDVNGTSATTVSGIPGFTSELMTSTTSVSRNLDYFGTVRARFGYLVTPGLLVYGTGGFAYGEVHASTAISQGDTGILPGPISVAYSSAASISQMRTGWTAGVGAEMQIAPQWTAKLEYLYYDLGSVTFGQGPLVANVSTFVQPTWVIAAQSTAKFSGDIVRMGLNYKF